MNYRIHHETRYRYGEPTTVSYNEVRLCPQNTGNQKLLCKNITVDPRPAEINERSDYFGNLVWFVAIDRPHKEMRVTVDSHLKLTPRARPEKLSNSPAWETARSRVQHPREGEEIVAVEYLLDSPLVSASEALADYAHPSFTPRRPLMLAINDLMARIYADFKFTPGFTNTATPLSEVIKHRKGVCQDFAHLAIGCLRSMGLPARYVSGYIETLPPPGKPNPGRRRLPRLVFGLYSHLWVARLRPHQQPVADRSAHRRRIWPRFLRRQSHQRGDLQRRMA
jgi:transglutaminase-like putative cysteine protease